MAKLTQKDWRVVETVAEESYQVVVDGLTEYEDDHDYTASMLRAIRSHLRILFADDLENLTSQD